MIVLLFSLLATANALCPPGYTYSSDYNKCYYYYEVLSDYFNAELQCSLDGAQLTSIINAYNNGYIAGLSNEHLGISHWIGLSRLVNDSGWQWLDGATSSYTNWSPGQPGTDKCAAIKDKTNQWESRDCSDQLPFICLFDPSANHTCPSCPTCPQITTPSPPICTTPPPKPCPLRCDEGWTYFSETKSCYQTNFGKNYDNGEQYCNGFGAHLTSIHSANENQFVINLSKTGLQDLPEQNQVVIGLKKDCGNCEWKCMAITTTGDTESQELIVKISVLSYSLIRKKENGANGSTCGAHGLAIPYIERLSVKSQPIIENESVCINLCQDFFSFSRKCSQQGRRDSLPPSRLLLPIIKQSPWKLRCPESPIDHSSIMPGDTESDLRRNEQQPLLRDRTRVLAGRVQGMFVRHHMKWIMVTTLYLSTVSLVGEGFNVSCQFDALVRKCAPNPRDARARLPMTALELSMDWLAVFPHLILTNTFAEREDDTPKMHFTLIVAMSMRAMFFFTKYTILFLEFNEFLHNFVFCTINVIISATAMVASTFRINFVVDCDELD